MKNEIQIFITKMFTGPTDRQTDGRWRESDQKCSIEFSAEESLKAAP